MKLVFPDITYKEKAIDFINSFKKAKSSVNGTGSLPRFLENYSYEEWLIKLQKDLDVYNLSEDKLPALTYFYVDDDDEIVGMINCRFGLNAIQEQDFGHIGYSIRPEKRNLGYGTKMLKEALKIYKKTKYFEVYVCANTDNFASIRVIENNEGIFVKSYYEEKYGGKCNCYRIKISSNGKIIHTNKKET